MRSRSAPPWGSMGCSTGEVTTSYGRTMETATSTTDTTGKEVSREYTDESGNTRDYTEDLVRDLRASLAESFERDSQSTISKMQETSFTNTLNYEVLCGQDGHGAYTWQWVIEGLDANGHRFEVPTDHIRCLEANQGRPRCPPEHCGNEECDCCTSRSWAPEWFEGIDICAKHGECPGDNDDFIQRSFGTAHEDATTCAAAASRGWCSAATVTTFGRDPEVLAAQVADACPCTCQKALKTTTSTTATNTPSSMSTRTMIVLDMSTAKSTLDAEQAQVPDAGGELTAAVAYADVFANDDDYAVGDANDAYSDSSHDSSWGIPGSAAHATVPPSKSNSEAEAAVEAGDPDPASKGDSDLTLIVIVGSAVLALALVITCVGLVIRRRQSQPRPKHRGIDVERAAAVPFKAFEIQNPISDSAASQPPQYNARAQPPLQQLQHYAAAPAGARGVGHY